MAQFTARHPKVGGRAKGTPNKSTLAGREFALALVNDETYRANLRERLLAGKVPPGVESMIWHYALGKPRESFELSGNIGDGRDVSQMSTDELLAELEQHHAATAAFLAAQRHGTLATPEQDG